MQISVPGTTPPYFALADDDPAVVAFPTASALFGYIEAVDVEDGLWEVMDSQGRRLELSTQRNSIAARSSADLPEPGLLRDWILKTYGFTQNQEELASLERLSTSKLTERAVENLCVKYESPWGCLMALIRAILPSRKISEATCSKSK